MKKNHTNLFTPSLFTLSIYEIIYAALFKDYQIFYHKQCWFSQDLNKSNKRQIYVYNIFL